MRTPKLALVIVLAAAAGLNCDDSKGGGADGGGRDGAGTGGTGGTTATGGTGGSTATGGTGGSAATGGTGGTATGGTGGTTATGGTGGTTATGGTGGTSATGGMGGTSATGGTGGAPASCDIPCISSLIANCAPMGTCVSATTLIPPAFNQCYSNGVKLSTAISLGGGGAGSATVTYSKSGAVCYSIDVMSATGMNFTFNYKNPAGTVVATGTYDNAMMKTTLTCAGSATVYDLNNPACANVPRGQMPGMGGGDAGANQCPMGACP